MILALDIGRYTGWAAGGLDVMPPRLGTVDVPWPVPVMVDGQARGYDYGRTVEAWANAMLLLLDEVKPAHLYVEAPWLNPKAGARDEVFLRLVQGFMPLRLEEIARRRRLAVTEVNVGTVRAVFCNKAPRVAPNGRTLSADERVALACQARGWRTADSHQADAAALYAFARQELARKVVA